MIDWLSDIWQFLQYWFHEMFVNVAKIGTSFWGLIVIFAGLLWTVLNHIVPMLSLVLDSLNAMVTGNFNYAPPSAIMNVLAIANTFMPVEELMAFGVAYGTLRGSLALYRFVKSYLPTEGSV